MFTQHLPLPSPRYKLIKLEHDGELKLFQSSHKKQCEEERRDGQVKAKIDDMERTRVKHEREVEERRARMELGAEQ